MTLIAILAAHAAESGIQNVPSRTWCEGLSRRECASRARSAGALSIDDTADGEQIRLPTVAYEEWLALKTDAYAARVLDELGLAAEMSASDSWNDALMSMSESTASESTASESTLMEADDGGTDGDWTVTPLACTEGGVTSDTSPDGLGGCKMIFASDSRALVTAPRTYPHGKQVIYVRRRAINAETSFTVCSGTFVSETYVLTAAHCVYDTDANDWLYANATNPYVDPADVTTTYGVDSGRGYVCLGDSIDSIAEFAGNCEFVEARSVLTGYPAATGGTLDAIEHDVALLRLSTTNHATGLGDSNWMAMSTISSAAVLETKVAVSHGYPGVAPSSTTNLYLTTVTVGGNTWSLVGRDQYKTSGIIDTPTTNARLMTKLESSQGQSGAGIFYYSDDGTSYTGQSHYLIGLVSSFLVDNNGSTLNDYTAGPTVEQFRDWVLGII